ncbi:MAG: hypothetical protein RPT13_03820 [SAR324 cluster bacterium]
MTHSQMNWCSEHDWFVSASAVAGDWMVETREIDSVDSIIFNDFKLIQEWAGY